MVLTTSSLLNFVTYGSLSPSFNRIPDMSHNFCALVKIHSQYCQWTHSFAWNPLWLWKNEIFACVKQLWDQRYTISTLSTVWIKILFLSPIWIKSDWKLLWFKKCIFFVVDSFAKLNGIEKDLVVDWNRFLLSFNKNNCYIHNRRRKKQ